jgi:hypothetical protein
MRRADRRKRPCRTYVEAALGTPGFAKRCLWCPEPSRVRLNSAQPSAKRWQCSPSTPATALGSTVSGSSPIRPNPSPRAISTWWPMPRARPPRLSPRPLPVPPWSGPPVGNGAVSIGGEARRRPARASRQRRARRRPSPPPASPAAAAGPREPRPRWRSWPRSRCDLR